MYKTLINLKDAQDMISLIIFLLLVLKLKMTSLFKLLCLNLYQTIQFVSLKTCHILEEVIQFDINLFT